MFVLHTSFTNTFKKKPLEIAWLCCLSSCFGWLYTIVFVSLSRDSNDVLLILSLFDCFSILKASCWCLFRLWRWNNTRLFLLFFSSVSIFSDPFDHYYLFSRHFFPPPFLVTRCAFPRSYLCSMEYTEPTYVTFLLFIFLDVSLSILNPPTSQSMHRENNKATRTRKKSKEKKE